MKRKYIYIILIMAMLMIGLVYQNSFIRLYVRLNNEKLTSYTGELLEAATQTDTRYGLWDVNIYHDEQMVEFRTGGFGLVPNTTYCGFYYSADNVHKPFQAADVTMEINGTEAVWTDGTDNHGKSVLITDNWFWYEAAF